MDTSYQHVQVLVSHHIASVRLNRPPVNALSQDFVKELAKLASAFHRNKEIWTVTLSASGHVFCAGADLKERRAQTASQAERAVQRIQQMVLSWMRIPQPVIVVVQGAALGGGLELVLAADIIVASEVAILGFPEVGLGIIPGATGTQRLTMRTTLGVASKWVLSGARFDAAEALRDGVVDFTFPSASLTEESERIISQVASGAPLALRQAKRSLNATYRLALQRGLRTESECYRQLVRSDDRNEALQAFADKRKPVWKGR